LQLSLRGSNEVRILRSLDEDYNIRRDIDLQEIRNLDAKRLLGKYEVNVSDDEKRRRRRDDFGSFGGSHTSSSAMIYLPPILGWKKPSASY
jgi:hypothetical protein